MTMVDRGLVFLPLSFLLKDRLHVAPLAMAVFMTVGVSPLWLKPVTGWISDSFPIRGSYRRTYLVIGTTFAGLGWIALAFLPLRFGVLLSGVFFVTLALGLVSSTMGAVQVEEGQALGNSGKLSSIRSLGANLANISGAACGGLLAGRAFGWVCGIAAACMLALIPIARSWTVEADRSSLVPAQAQVGLKQHWHRIKAARSLWIAILILVCIDLAPGFTTPLFYVQTDVNHFSPHFISLLKVAGYMAMLTAGGLYFAFSSRFQMRTLLLLVVLIGGLTPFGYLHYRTHGQALVVDSIYALVYELGTIVLIDLSVRATPKGSEGFCFGLLYSGMMIAANGSDVVGSFLYDHFHLPFSALVSINAGITLLALFLVPLLPREILEHREGGLRNGVGFSSQPALATDDPA